jgi:hypothetical protein
MVVAELVLVDFRNQRRNSPQSPVFFDQIIEQPLPSIPNMCIHADCYTSRSVFRQGVDDQMRRRHHRGRRMSSRRHLRATGGLVTHDFT